MALRPYQQETIDLLYQWMRDNKRGNPCVVLPTGAGKSHIIATICEDAVKRWPDTRVLMLTHQKELIAQNSEKLRAAWPNVPLGIYSAGMGQRDIDTITFAGIQSIHKKARILGHIDLILIDECHLVNHRAEGMYRRLIDDLQAINPALRVIGLTATPYRLGHGYINDGDAIFDSLVSPVSIGQLVHEGFLAPLRSKVTELTLDTSGVKKRGGDFIESDLQRAVDTDDNNMAVVDQVIELAGDRRSWLFFCAGVEHARHIRDALRVRGVNAETVNGKTPRDERDDILKRFKAGELTALTNANVLTTGFDAPNIDLIAMVRPTESTGLYVQMAGRGLRLKEHTDHCLVLDFAGVVRRHGPITFVQPESKVGSDSEPGEAPVKVCDHCHELCHLSAKFCTSCGALFPEKEKKDRGIFLHDDDIMGEDGNKIEVKSWHWYPDTSKRSGNRMLVVAYQPVKLSSRPVREYLTVYHDGIAAQRAWAAMYSIMRGANVQVGQDEAETIERLNAAPPPKEIAVKKDGQFMRVLRRHW